MKTKYTQEQVAFAEATDSKIYLKALAGCGKTTSVMGRIETQQANGRKIALATSFTNSGVDALRENLSKRNINNVGVSTISKLAFDLVNKNLGRNVFIDTQKLDELAERAYREVTGLVQPNRRQISEIQRWSTFKINVAAHYWDPSISAEALEKINSRWIELRQSQKLLTFDEVMTVGTKFARPLDGEIIVDEAQDLTRSQYLFIEKLAGSKGQVTFVGDPNQSIYRFSGVRGDSGTRNLKTKFAEYELTETFRSSQAVVDVANLALAKIQSFTGSTDVHELKTNIPGGRVTWTDTDFHEQIGLVAKQLKPGDTLLARTKRELDAVMHSPEMSMRFSDALSWHQDNQNLPFRFMTIHKSKGLEFGNTVHVMGVTKDGFEEIKNIEDLSLLYVALTRAKDSLHIYNTDIERPF